MYMMNFFWRVYTRWCWTSDGKTVWEWLFTNNNIEIWSFESFFQEYVQIETAFSKMAWGEKNTEINEILTVECWVRLLQPRTRAVTSATRTPIITTVTIPWIPSAAAARKGPPSSPTWGSHWSAPSTRTLSRPVRSFRLCQTRSTWRKKWYACGFVTGETFLSIIREHFWNSLKRKVLPNFKTNDDELIKNFL